MKSNISSCITTQRSENISTFIEDTPYQLRGATDVIDISNGKINFYQHFTDPEDEESLHRWNWLLQIATNSTGNQHRCYWALTMQELWIENFQHEIYF